ncbi:hypothetical protein HWV62_31629 [Athelia sp. TMB]|nr:hypothetical protein HWV62_31629 [Athelia sp. TMB]
MMRRSRRIEDKALKKALLARTTNEDALISTLHDEILAMIFEIGTNDNLAGPDWTFACSVSHVCSHWRTIALALPRIWTKTWCMKCVDEDALDPDILEGQYLEEEIHRLSVFLARSKSLPVEIHIQHLHEQDLDGASGAIFVQLICNHIEHCSHLGINEGDAPGMLTLMTHISRHPTPMLRSIELRLHTRYWTDAKALASISSLPALSQAPHLTSAQLAETEYLPFLISSHSIARITSLRIRRDRNHTDMAISSIRECFMAMKELVDLELDINPFPPLNLPIMLPSVRSLKLKCGDVQSFCGPFVTNLGIAHYCGPLEDEEAKIRAQFPHVQHLVLPGEPIGNLEFNQLACSFPAVTRITCPFDFFTDDGRAHPIELIYNAITNAKDSAGNLVMGWPKLQTITFFTHDDDDYRPLYALGWYNKISVLRRAGHPIRKLMMYNPFDDRFVLPDDPREASVNQANYGAISDLRELVEVEFHKMHHLKGVIPFVESGLHGDIWNRWNDDELFWAACAMFEE